MHRVVFQSARRAVEAEPGENLLMLARRSGVHIDSSCGGNGSCHQCRVMLDAPQDFRDTQGRPVAPQHKREGKPVWLACRGTVCGPLSVESAPVHGIGVPPSPSLAGWQVGPPGRAGPIQVFDPRTGATLVVDGPSGEITSEANGTTGDVVIDRDLGRAQAIAQGAGLPLPARVIDLGGMVVVAHDGGIRQAQVDTTPLHTPVGHQPGAIYWVEWSPLKTRTVIETWQGAEPIGLSTGGLVATVSALLQAGMMSADGTLRDSRFVRTGAQGREVILLGPKMEAVTPGGTVWTSEHEVVLTQTQIRAVLDTLARLRAAADGLGGRDYRQVISGPPGVALSAVQLQWLGFEGAVFIPNATGLGAARWAVVNR